MLVALPYAIKRLDEEEAYRYYVTDCLYYLRRDKTLSRRFYDMVKNPVAKADNRTGDEIAADLIKKMGLKL